MLDRLKKKILKPQNKLEFVSLLPEVTKIMPIIPASKQQYNWVKKAYENYKKSDYKDKNSNSDRFTHVMRCPGMISLNNTGWIQRSWQDIIIETNGDGKTFEWRTPINQKIMDTDHGWKWDYISYHSEDNYGVYNTDKKNIQSVVKVQSPWIVYVPKGYSLLCMPIPYPDNHDFTSCIGFLEDADKGPNFLNVQMFWHVFDGATKIPAGTPLCQYILVKKDKVDSVVRGYEKKDIDNLRLRAHLLDSKFVPNYNDLKKVRWN